MNRDSECQAGPLAGLRVVEIAALGPAPFAGMLLADLGADVVKIARIGQAAAVKEDFVQRGRRSIELDLKDPTSVQSVLDLLAKADVLIEGFRPGVMERLGLGPKDAWARNPRLVYGRMTGWGQDGPLADRAGHDINYISISGSLGSFRAADGTPVAPLNMVGDYGGGSLYLVVGVLAAVMEAWRSGKGQVVDAAMCDGASHMLTSFHSLLRMGMWTAKPGKNIIDGGAHYYRSYRCADGEYLSVGAIEKQFYAIFCQLIGAGQRMAENQNKQSLWPEFQNELEAIFVKKTRNEWMAIFDGTDACVAPVVNLVEGPSHPHLAQRGTFVNHNGYVQPAPAPRFSRTVAKIGASPDAPLVDVSSVLATWTQSNVFQREPAE